jgi:hypothetical protein
VSKAAKIVEQMRAHRRTSASTIWPRSALITSANPRQDGTSHKVYKTPRQGDPRVNIQRGKDGNAKAYQVRQVLDAIATLEAEKSEESDDDA